MTHALVLLTSLAGFAALALANDRQQDAIVGRALPCSASRLLQVFGTAALSGAYALAVWLWGFGLGTVTYSGHTSVAAALVFLAFVTGARMAATPAQRRGPP